ncbi:hypothetical protein CEXT_243081 [Caerostris extrusa]|uniref:Uncharacterized protein n=1 Tax=Caerostris extrusa TaxID=172846 RepID=A0AAV4S814_CAEEX|nr:hypothetical protein CEXT_243081 [Caerostris extrusa]
MKYTPLTPKKKSLQGPKQPLTIQDSYCKNWFLSDTRISCQALKPIKWNRVEMAEKPSRKFHAKMKKIFLQGPKQFPGQSRTVTGKSGFSPTLVFRVRR